MHNRKPVMLVILDGLGYAPHATTGAYYHAHMPHLKSWLTHYPHAFLDACGMAVGLPDGYVGNSQVGHLTIGSGCITKEPVTLINEAINSGDFFTNRLLISALERVAQRKTTLHIMGLLSDAGVHALQDHLSAYLQAAKTAGITTIVIHAFLDGRDTPPKSAAVYLEALDTILQQYPHAFLGSICGRFMAMDRDNNYARTNALVTMLTHPSTKRFNSWGQALDYYYAKNITDEFIPPVQLDKRALITSHDTVIFTNFRADRARQLTKQLMQAVPITKSQFITPVSYGSSLETTALFEQQMPPTTVKKELVRNKKTIFTIAETEKYAHVTYFFDAKQEKKYPQETRILIPSLKEVTYARTPKMSAELITTTVLDSLANNPHDFYLINYANADMVGHSGNFKSTVTALEFLDTCLQKLYHQCVELNGGTMIITADHGNAELVCPVQGDEQPKTAHTFSKVFFIVLQPNSDKKENPTIFSLTGLKDIAPFILNLFGIPIPESMKK